MKRSFGITNDCLPGLYGTAEEIKKIRDAGFEHFFSSYFDEKTVYGQKNTGEKIGLQLDFLHAPFAGVNDFFKDSEEDPKIFREVMESIDSASACGIPLVVMHVSSGWTPPKMNEIALSRFDRAVENAAKKKVKIAFENIRETERLAIIMERYKDLSNVGFCYDCGHEHCYTETVDFLQRYGDRILCTHLHDNFGRDKEDPMKDADYHMMPFDGTMDYADMMRRLDACNYQGTLMLEIDKKGKYLEKSDEEFLRISYERLQKIADFSKT